MEVGLYKLYSMNMERILQYLCYPSNSIMYLVFSGSDKYLI